MTKDEQLKIYAAYLQHDLLFYPSENSDLFDDLYADNFPHTTRNYRLALQEKDKDAIKISNSYLKQKVPFITIEDGEVFLGQFESSLGFDVDDVFSSEVKPILYDLSDLTKEIEHEGKKIIPIVELLKIKYPNQKGRYSDTDYSTEGYAKAWFTVDAAKEIMIRDFDLQNEHYWIIQKLIELHFNVFSLTEDQFINKATLKN